MAKREKYGVWRLKKQGGWKLIATFQEKDPARALAKRMRAEIITVKWGKIR